MSIPAVTGEIDKPENIRDTLNIEQIKKIKEFITNTFDYNISTEEISSITKSKSTPQRKKVELTVSQAIEKFDRRYAQLFLGSHYVVWDKKEKSPKELAGLRNFYSDFVVKKSETHGGRMQTVDKPAIDIWFEYTCNRFEKCEFLPGRAVIPEGIFNLWDGWSVAPKKTGSCKLFLDHVFENICNRDQLLFDFLMDWVADIFQHPDRKNGIQVTLYSREQGTGKSFFWEVVAKLLEGLLERGCNAGGVTAFDISTRHKIGELAFVQNRNAGRRRWLSGKIFSRACSGRHILSGEYADRVGRPDRALQCGTNRRAHLARRAAADGVHHHHQRSLVRADHRVHLFRRARFLHTKARQFLAHRHNHQLWIHMFPFCEIAS